MTTALANLSVPSLDKLKKLAGSENAKAFQNFLIDLLLGVQSGNTMEMTAATELTIASGAIASTQASHTVDTQNDDPTDDLDSITGGTADQLLVLRPANAARTVVLKHAIGSNKIANLGGRDISLAEATDVALLFYNGTQWITVAYNTLADGIYAATGAWTGPQTFQKILYGASSELTIATGSVAATRSAHTLDTEGDAATDDLDSITGGSVGMQLLVRLESAARDVVLKHAIGADKIACPGGQDITLGAATDWALLEYNGTQWTVVGASILQSDGARIRLIGTIAFAAVRTLNATPVTMIAAPGAGKYIEVERVHWFLDFGTAAYDAAAAGDTLEAKYTDGSGAAVVDAVAGNAIGSASADYHALVRAVPEVIPVANAPIVAHINTGEWYSAAGDSPLKYEVAYTIQTLDFA